MASALMEFTIRSYAKTETKPNPPADRFGFHAMGFTYVDAVPSGLGVIENC